MSASPEIRVLPTPHALVEEAARFVRDAAQQAVADHNRFALALSGGETPQALYALLAEAGPDTLPYNRVEIFWSDERGVPPDHEESNYGLAWKVWLARAPLDPRRIHRLRGEDDPERAAADYEAELRRVLGDPPRLDLVLLGVGRDGHTASLFPGEAALASNRLVAAATAPVPPQRRITVTPRLIEAAARVLVLVTGRDKAEAVRRALEDAPTPAVPASLLRGPGITWFLDDAAASVLSPR
ncbi:MAG: 6-phosphogluconolactonase, 6-phosphogluconolactonase [Armatimonadetes bacterium CSP1-3]|nr:MAG: 6-phosphogluconolactonase, 6-phosphogluconolactonase [Armatimonadetes bacterium CSP1-3]